VTKLDADRRFRIFAYLLKMRAHGAAGHLGIVPLHRLKNALVMDLSALRSALDIKDSYALLAQQSDDGIDQGKNERIRGRFRQCQMKVEIGFDVGLGSLCARSMTVTASRIATISGSCTRAAANAAIPGSRIKRNSAKCGEPSCCPTFTMRSKDWRAAWVVPSVIKVPRPE